MLTGKQTTAMAGFIALGLSPSFVDWQQEPGQRVWIVLYYGVAIALIYWGLFSP